MSLDLKLAGKEILENTIYHDAASIIITFDLLQM